MKTLPPFALRRAMQITAIALAAPAAFAATGPSSSATPFLTPLDPAVEFTSLLSVGDSVRLKNKGNETYRMSGIPDGLGAFDNGDGTFTVLMNHELRNTVGVPRTHGGKGAFVSKWQVRKSDLKVLNGRDLVDNVKLWDGTGFVDAPGTVFNRFCSADLAAPSAFYNSVSGRGFNEGRIFLNGEETSGGRAFAHLAAGRQHGTTWQLPALGAAAWENLVASPFEQDRTVVAGLDDGELNASKLFIFVGHKQSSGTPIEQAGLASGDLYQVVVDGYATESASAPGIPNGFTGTFSLSTSGGTGLNRVEDGAWDPVDPRRFYFVTTASFTGNSRLWRLTFADITNPAAGGAIEVLIDGAVTGQKMMDNLAVDSDGNVYLQEDVGNQAHLGKIWRYATDGSVTLLAEHDATRFLAGAAADIDGTENKQSDEESSGIVEVSRLFDGEPGYDTETWRYFLLDVQAHYSGVSGTPLAADLVEGGQLLLMRVAR